MQRYINVPSVGKGIKIQKPDMILMSQYYFQVETDRESKNRNKGTKYL